MGRGRGTHSTSAQYSGGTHITKSCDTTTSFCHMFRYPTLWPLHCSSHYMCSIAIWRLALLTHLDITLCEVSDHVLEVGKQESPSVSEIKIMFNYLISRLYFTLYFLNMLTTFQVTWEIMKAKIKVEIKVELKVEIKVEICMSTYMTTYRRRLTEK